MSSNGSPLLSPRDEPEPHQEIDAVNEQLNGLDTSAEPEEEVDTTIHSNGSAVTRTVAIIKPHALQHRFDIERKIEEAGFEIVKERQMEFDVETDPETLFELFGEDAESFAEGPVWVYVLERRRAVEVWINLMGDEDPGVARRDAPHSIRALYGKSRMQNGILGSPDRETAEVQIASLFSSSPPFPSSELPDDQFGTVTSASSSMLSALRRGDSEYSATSPGGSKVRLGINKQFSARALPVTHLQPDIVPRMTKAAALRAGVAPPKFIGSMGHLPSAAARPSITKERHSQTFLNTPGHKRAATITVASTAAPAIAPRTTKAAALRAGIKPEAVKRAPSATGTRSGSFQGVPGHKRAEIIPVASVAAPTIAPRMTKSASLRQAPKAPPTSFMFRAPSESKTPTLSRSNSQSSLGANRPSLARRPSSQMSMGGPISRTTSMSSSANGSSTGNGSPGSDEALKPKRVVPRPSSISNPSIAPRTNKSAALRAAKKAEEEEFARLAEERARKAARRRTVGVTPRSIAA